MPSHELAQGQSHNCGRIWRKTTLLPLATGLKAIQKKTGETVSEIAIGYRNSPIVENHRLSAGPRAGDRAPDATVLEFSKGHEISLMSIFGKDHVLLALAGPEPQAQEKLQETILLVRERYGDLVRSSENRRKQKGSSGIRA
jgi:hypothetical protein